MTLLPLWLILGIVASSRHSAHARRIRSEFVKKIDDALAPHALGLSVRSVDPLRIG